ncbi:acyltransferase domain-containing protein [Streptomyces sp. NPDC047000]|uniref:type I polyketide synthase n=1 Tax=Streptomyces sp. NPDC047000 TaxID=3155474 RepID=UPI0033E32AF7
MAALDQDSAVAVVGMGCRFPHAASVDEYWHNLLANTDSVSRVPPDRFDVDACHSAVPGTPGRTVSRFGGFLDDPFAFDPAFFGIAPSEAVTLDPQHRLLLTVVWEALEDAGIVPSALAGSRTGVYVGQATAEYARHGDLERHSLREATGSHLRSMATGRISYALDLHGPSLVVDTACSSSLVAVHMARQSLLSGENTLAIAGGVNVILSPYDAVAYSQASMLSPDGRCKFGAENADGFVRSEGAGVVLLKRLADAERDGDRVLAVLHGSAAVNDGRGSGLPLKPAVPGQVDTVRAACREAGVEPASLDYVEAHGTGTAVGDGVELTALAEAVRDGRAPARPLLTGSVKSNIGHTEAAAGIAGLIKAVLVVRHRTIPASLHAGRPHPLLTRDDMPVEVVTANTPLDPAGDRALAGVSSFGLSGTNAHVVVGAHRPGRGTPQPDPGRDGSAAFTRRSPHLLVLSARSRRSLLRLAAAYAEHLGPDGPGRAHSPADICATAALRREPLPHRLWVTGSGHDELAAGLRAVAEDRTVDNAGTGEAGYGPGRRTVFVFPGQGSQWAGMGRTLMASSPAFRHALRECDAAVRGETGWSVIDVLTEAKTEFPADVAVVQPVLWAVQTALAAHWRAMGVTPDVCLGHSMGEAAAAGVSGALSLADAAAVICRRSRLMGQLSGRGGMLATGLSGAAARDLVLAEGPGLCVAAENAPDSTVLAGDRAVLERVAGVLAERGVFHRTVPVDVASHAPMMDPLRAPLAAALAGLLPRTPRVPMYSSVFCREIDGPQLDAAYWMSNLREPVRFRESVRHLAEEAESVFVEVAPHPVLGPAVCATLDDAGAAGAVAGSTRRQQDEQESLTRALGHCFAEGGRVDWRRWFGSSAPHVPLPHYRWDEQHLRLTEAGSAAHPPRGHAEGAGHFPVDERATGVRVRGLAPVPPVVHLAVLHDAARAAGLGSEVLIADAMVGGAWTEVPRGGRVLLRAVLGPAADGGHTATVRAVPDGPGEQPGTTCLTASVRPAAGTPAVFDAHPALARCRVCWSGPEFFGHLEGQGYEIAPSFRTVHTLWRGDGEAVALLHRPELPRHAVWETCLLPLLAAVPSGALYRPVSFGHTRIVADLPEEFWVHATFSAAPDGATATADVTVAAPGGRVLAEFRAVALRRWPEPAQDRGPLPARSGQLAALAHRWPEVASRLPSLPTGLPALVDRLPGTAAELRGTAARLASRAVVAGQSSVGGWLTGLLASPDFAPVPAWPAAPVPTAPDPAPSEVAEPPCPAEAPVGQVLVRSAARLLGMPPEQIDEHRALRDYGLDSLMAHQLRKELLDHGIEISLNRLVGTESARQLTM